MNNSLILFSLVIVLVFCPSVSLKSNSEYTFIKAADGVSLYYRNVTLPGGELTCELKAEFMIEADRNDVTELIRNDQKAAMWMKRTEKIDNVERLSNGWVTYIEYDFPWPMSNKDCVLLYNLTYLKTKCKIEFESVPDYMKRNPNLDRIGFMKGCWTITQFQSKSCKVEYTVYLEKGSKFPSLCGNPFIQQNLIDCFTAMRKIPEGL